MTLKDLMKKIEQLNKINSELGIDRSYYLVTSDKYCSKVIYLYKIEFINGSNEIVEYNIRIGVK